MSENTDTANDYALAKILNERVINVFTLVVDHSNTPDITAVNRSYILMVDELKQIYDRQPELKKIGTAICWRILDNLELAHEVVLAIEFTHSGSDYGEGHNSSVSRLCIIADKLKPDLTPKVQDLLNDADKNIAEFKAELDKMYATLSFESISVPVVTIGDEKYRLSTMRDGLAFAIISYCRIKHPDVQIDIESLRSELKTAGLNSHGLKNLKENIRNSHFDEKSPLRPFVTVFPKVITVKSTTALTDEQIDIIRSAKV